MNWFSGSSYPADRRRGGATAAPRVSDQAEEEALAEALRRSMGPSSPVVVQATWAEPNAATATATPTTPLSSLGGGAPWPCGLCTFENTAQAIACGMCQSSRPSSGSDGAPPPAYEHLPAKVVAGGPAQGAATAGASESPVRGGNGGRGVGKGTSGGKGGGGKGGGGGGNGKGGGKGGRGDLKQFLQLYAGASDQVSWAEMWALGVANASEGCLGTGVVSCFMGACVLLASLGGRRGVRYSGTP